MKNKKVIIFLLIVVILFILLIPIPKKPADLETSDEFIELVRLPEPSYEGAMSVEEAIKKRRSIRNYKDESLSLNEISQLLWSAQGITDKRTGFRSAPSAGATYPLEVYLVVGNVNGLSRGIYHYTPRMHTIELLKMGDYRKDLEEAAFGQRWVGDAPISLIFTAIYNRTTSRYGKRGIRYVHLETGHAAQNVYLQATALNLGTVVVGAFDDQRIKEILNLTNEEPLYIMPVGRI
ncbi:MAG: nitroreductase [Candidatus Altiarchaeales archaeon]|nr:MAG: nitroreductase [Candidatus Altiarchaeales archaeon]RLI94134.1 MAG: nitroreductase [Candidatus Altiarchaeales archaeon]RLI94265.1 MAG: nitroreductase [Candidatus Altiarchaeales archaeon]